MNETESESLPTGGEDSIRELYRRLRFAEDLIGAMGTELAATAWLAWRDAEGTVRAVTGRDRLSVGRDPGNDVVLSAPGVSRRHCSLSRDEGLVFIEDHGSRNGTFLNGGRVERRGALCSGDILEIGGVPLLFLGDPTAGGE